MLSLFLLLLLIHLLADFSLQPLSWIIDRQEKKARSGKLILHVFTHSLLSWLVLFNFHLWWVALAIFVTHWLCDVWKSHQKTGLASYLTDQIFHIAVLAVLSFMISQQNADLPILDLFNEPEKWLVIACVTLAALRPIGMVVMYFMKKFELDASDNHALEHAGKWIGYFERIIIIMSVLVQAYTVLGLLVAAKSLLRYNENNRNRKHTEYVLVGSLLSWGLGMALGLTARLVMY